MVKNYLELNNEEKNKLISFMNRNKMSYSSLEDMDKHFKGEEFDYGRGVISVFQDGKVIAAASVVLMECKVKGVAYVIKPELEEGLADRQSRLMEITGQARKLVNEYGAREIFLGTSSDELMNSLKELGMDCLYLAVKMTLMDRTVKYPALNLIKLNEDNKKEYLNIYNDAFRYVPNGSTLTKGELEDHLNSADENHCWYMAEYNNRNIGFLQFKIEDGAGEFDLGLIERERGKGFGKLLLETAIGYLNHRNVKEINLTVITKNERAYDMYVKRGFKETGLLSRWYKL